VLGTEAFIRLRSKDHDLLAMIIHIEGAIHPNNMEYAIHAIPYNRGVPTEAKRKKINILRNCIRYMGVERIPSDFLIAAAFTWRMPKLGPRHTT